MCVDAPPQSIKTKQCQRTIHLRTSSHSFMSRFPYFLETLYYEKYARTSVLPADFHTNPVKYGWAGKSDTSHCMQAKKTPWAIFFSEYLASAQLTSKNNHYLAVLMHILPACLFETGFESTPTGNTHQTVHYSQYCSTWGSIKKQVNTDMKL